MKRIRVSAVMAGLMAIAGASAQAADLWVGTRNAATGQFAMRPDVLNVLSSTFGDGKPVGSYSIVEVHDGLANSNGFLLARKTAPGSGTCRTEATAVHLHGAQAYLNLDLDDYSVLMCANPPGLACGSCKIEHDLSGYFCACIKNGSVAGECLGAMNDVLKGTFDVEWMGPDPDPVQNPGPHGPRS